MNENPGFYTLKGYQIAEDTELTAAMEDYLEMICRISLEKRAIRVNDLSRLLHVKPSSASKMIRHLSEAGYLQAAKYGLISLTKKGKAAGDYLLLRHDVLHQFLCIINHSQNELEQVEKVEHFLNRNTVENIQRINRILLRHPELSRLPPET